MVIVKLEAENVKKLKAVRITPKGPLVQVTGRNGHGKSSVLDAIWWALGGKEEIQSVPIRKGADKAMIRLDLGDMVVERKFTATGSHGGTMVVRNKDGAVYPSPQKMLDALIGRLAFDPLAFSKKKPREQYEEIKVIAKVDVDLDALEAANKADFEKRTDVNRRAKVLRAQAEGIQAPADPPARVNVAKLAAEMEEASRYNAALEVEKRKRSSAEQAANLARQSAEKLCAELPGVVQALQADMDAEIQAVRDKFAGRIAAATMAADKAEREGVEKLLAFRNMAHPGEPIDLGAIRARIERAEQINSDCDLQEKRASIVSEAKALEAESAALTAAMDLRETQKIDALQKAEMPVPGLSLGNGIVMLDGLPLDQASDAQQLRLSVAVAMAANPKLRVIRIRDGSLLDDDGMAILREMAKDQEFQVWIEVVSKGKFGIVMEDGEVAGDYQEVTE